MSEPNMKPAPTIADIKRKNASSGQHWFEPGAMRFFSSRVAPGVYAGPGGVYFITSEQFRREMPRRYSVRQALENGSIDTVGEFQAHASLAAARRVAKQMAKGGPAEARESRNAAAAAKPVRPARATTRKTVKREAVAAKTAGPKAPPQPAAPKKAAPKKAKKPRPTAPKKKAIAKPAPELTVDTTSERRAENALREMVAALNRAERVASCEEVWAALLQAHDHRAKARAHLLAIPPALAGRTGNLVKTLDEADARAARIVELMGWCKGIGGKR